jgi:protein-tyrosine phosphatase
MRLLFVCTGNMCRSPVAERLAALWAQELLGGDAAEVEIASAGLGAPVGQAMDPLSAAALVQLGGDPADARAKAYTADMAEKADLVLTMTRRHRRAVLETFPRGLRRTFTLLEARELLDRADRRGLEQLPLGERAHELALRLDGARAQRSSLDADDIQDPVGRRAAVHHDVATTIAGALRPLATVLFADPRLEDADATAGDA